MRTSTIHGLAGAAAIMASTYKAYLGEGLGPLEEPLKQFKIPHPGRVSLLHAHAAARHTELGPLQQTCCRSDLQRPEAALPLQQSCLPLDCGCTSIHPSRWCMSLS